jgi:VWFA-related protein
MRFRRIADFIIASGMACHCLFAPTPAQSQEPKTKSPQEERLRISTELIQLDVVVTDREGRPVSNLSREDFELLEDGKPQRLSFFSIGTAKDPGAWLMPGQKRLSQDSGLPPAAVSPEGRHIVLAVDDFHLAPGNLPFARRAMLRFINEQMAGSDRLAIATTSGTLGFFQQFTDERSVLEYAINRLTVQNRTPGSFFDEPRMTEYQAQMIVLGNQEALDLITRQILSQNLQPAQPAQSGRGSGRSASRQNNEGGMTPRERAEAQARTRARMILAETARNTNASLAVLENIIRSLSALPGRKLIVLFSDGFLLGSGLASTHFDLQRITDAATRAGVVIYALDTRGLIAAAPGGNASEPGQALMSSLSGAVARLEQGAIEAKRDGLNALAEDTGGFAIFNQNDLSLGLQRALQDNETWYVLAYEPEQAWRDGRFHKIQARVKNRPELRVRTRKGYLAPTAKTAEKDQRRSTDGEAPTVEAKEKQLRSAMNSLFPVRDIPLNLVADFLDLPDSGSHIALVAQVEAAGLNFAPNGARRQAVIDLMVSVFDEQGQPASSFTERLDLNLRPETFEQVIRHGFSYRKLLPVKPGLYQTRVAVREEATARTGSNTRWIEVPDLSRRQLELSSIFLSSGESLDSALPDISTADKKPGAYQLRPAQASRRFRRNGALDFVVIAYNAAPGENGPPDLIIQAQIFAGSRLVYASPPTLMAQPGNTDHQRVPYAAQLPLGGFNPGDYELRLIVTDRVSKVSAKRSARFTVE